MKILRQLHNPTALELIKSTNELEHTKLVDQIKLDAFTLLPVGIATIKLVIEENTAIEQARQLIDRTRQQINSPPQARQLLQLIETILVYKFLSMSREEIAAMFEISNLKQSRFYQEAKKELRPEVRQEVRQEVELEIKLEAVPRLLALGLTVEQVAQALSLSVEQVRLAAPQ